MQKSRISFFFLSLFVGFSLCFLEEQAEVPAAFLTKAEPLSLNLGDSAVLPGVWHISDGLDILSFRQMAPIFSVSYATGQMTPDGVYKLPDGVAYIDSNSCDFFAQTNTAETYSDYKTTDTFSVEANAKFKVVSGSYSSKDTKIREEIYNNKMTISDSRVKCQIYDAMHFGGLQLSPFFTDALSKLPKTYDANAYRNLIASFGTHYRKRITLGGLLQQLTYTSSDYTKKYSKDSVTKQASASFYVSVSASSEHSKEITQEFKSSSSINQIETLGGQPWISGVDSWTQWASSIPQKPEVIYQELYPLTDLMTDAAIKANLDKAINDYAFVNGCTHPLASNFNKQATIDDGSCKDPYYIRPELRCSGSGMIFNVPDGCVDDNGHSSNNDNLQVYCCNGMARFCLSGEACGWRAGCPAPANDNYQSCSRSGLSNDWMATAHCNLYNGYSVFYCNVKGEVTLTH